MNLDPIGAGRMRPSGKFMTSMKRYEQLPQKLYFEDLYYKRGVLSWA